MTTINLEKDEAASADEIFGRSFRYAWYVVILLTAVQVVSYIDRFLPGLLIEPIKADLGLSDFQVGLLLGPAFGIFYVAVGIPLGWLADRYSRRAILSAGITIWCCMTAAASMARSFLPLFGARLGVGLGEAAVAPCAISIISDYFPRAKRAKALSIFMAGSFIGAGTAFLVGGPAVHAIAGLPAVVLPLVGETKPWQMAFLIIGLPGLIFAALMFTIREPLRRERTAAAGGDKGAAPLRLVLAYIAKRWRVFGTLFIGSACVVTLGSLAFWNVALFQRTWGWDVRQVGIATGMLFFTAGPIGTALCVWVTGRWIKQGRRDATIRCLFLGLLIGVPAYIAYPLMPTAEWAVFAMFFAFLGQAVATASGPSSISLIAPGQMRSQATAVYYLFISVAGQLIGPPPVGWIADRLGELRYAIAIEAAIVGGPILLLVFLGIPHFRRGVEQLEAEIGPQEAVHG